MKRELQKNKGIIIVWMSIVTIFLFLNVAVVSLSAAESLERHHSSGTDWGPTGVIPVPAIARPALAGFKLNFAGAVDHELWKVMVLADSDSVELDYSGALSQNGLPKYYWQVDRQELPPGTTFHSAPINDRYGFGYNQVIAGRGEFEGVPVLTGFSINWGGEHELKRIRIRVFIDQFGQLELGVSYEDKNHDDAFTGIVHYALVPANTVRCKNPLEGSSKTGYDAKAVDAAHPLLQGFDLNFKNGDHEMDEIGVMLLPSREGGLTQIWYNDKNDDDEFSWKVWWIDVSAEGIQPVVRDRYVGTYNGGSDSLRGQVNDCTNPSYPCLTLNHAISQSGHGDTIKVKIGETVASADGRDIEIKPSVPTKLKIEGGWNQDFTKRPIDINGYHFAMLKNGRFGIVADAIPLDLTISGFIMTGGTGENGGAIEVDSLNGGTATINIEHNKIEGNDAVRYGGAIYAFNGGSILRLNLKNNLITGNTSGRAGGGLLVESYDSGQSQVNLTNNVIADNAARLYGGGAFFNSQSGNMEASLINNTITRNSAGYYGGGFCARSLGREAAVRVDVANSIIWGNEARQDILISEIDSIGNATTVVNARYSDIGYVANYGGTYNDVAGNINQDPFFLDPFSGNYHLDMGSPAIDSGIYTNATPRYDFEGESRDNFCDMGADEFVGDDGQDDHGDWLDSATPVGINTATSGSIETGGDYDFFVVEVPTSGTLTVYTEGNTDTYGYLRKSTSSTMYEDDNGGQGDNFRIELQDASAGTYYIAVKHYSGSGTGNYQLRVEFSAG